ncbi:helix-turn-helix domain-containing protein [Streptomyces atratus]|uniref:helix-turn-helix domain-containing protein n=1 Tax=Streptomyces atratus TaxID=1893 RepID=UPI0033E71E21
MGTEEGAEARKRRANELGPTGKRVAENLADIRKARGMTMPALREEMAKLGRPLPATAVIKTEQKERRVDVDDLVAFALALNVSPLTLLLPREWDDSPVDLAPDFALKTRTAWRWAEGRSPANDWGTSPDGDELNDEAEQDYLKEREEYELLTHPAGRRRAAQRPANRAADTLSAMVGRLVNAVEGGNKAAAERQLRITKNRLTQLQTEIDQIELELGD